jgi:hypothetical protein
MRRIQRLTLSLFLIMCVSILMTSCGTTRAVLVPPGDLVKIGPDVRGQVYTWNGNDWILSDNKIVIPEGWLCGPPPPNRTTNDVNTPSPDPIN